MFDYRLETDSACVPYLSNNYIDSFCNDLVRRFDSSVIEQLHPLNIEQFAKKFMGLKLQFEDLTFNGSVLGAMIFDDCNFPIYDAKRHRAEYASVEKGTVLLDRSLTQASNNNRYRFTLAHEVGHALWHGMYRRAQIKAAKHGYLSCTNDTIRQCTANSIKSLTRDELVEYQANRSASALLMPKDAVNRLIAPMGECLTRDDAIDRIIYTASTFRVSDAAAKIRLADLGLINTNLIKSTKIRQSA